MSPSEVPWGNTPPATLTVPHHPPLILQKLWQGSQASISAHGAHCSSPTAPSTAVGWGPQNANPCSREEQSLQRAEQPMVGLLLNLQMETSKKFVTWYYVNALQDTQRLVYFQLIPTPFYSHRNYYCSQRKKKKLARTILMGLLSKGDPFFHVVERRKT